MKYHNLSGKTFGRLKALRRVGTAKDRHALWECLCQCGRVKLLPSNALTTGKIRSCGCLLVEAVVRHGESLILHGHSCGGVVTPEFQAYLSAKGRCENPNNKSYRNYGGRGIQFRFKDFNEFFLELGPRPSPTHSVDRVNNNGHYEKNNMRWATKSEQSKNQRKRKRTTGISEVAVI